MKLALKSLSVDKGDVRYEVHCDGCKDINKNDPIQVYYSDKFESAEDFIVKDMADDIGRECYRVMKCAL